MTKTTTKTMTLDQFEQLVNRKGWQHFEAIDVWEKTERPDHDGNLIPHLFGGGEITSTLGDITITCYEEWQCDLYEPRTFQQSVSDCITGPIKIEGVTITDIDIDVVDIIALLPGEFHQVDYTEFIEEQIDLTVNIDMTGDDSMETFTLEINHGPNLRFRGELVAETSSSSNNAHSDYSGETGRWSELYLYKTIGGKLVCHQIGRTQWQGEHTRFSGAVCDNEQEVIAFFGHGWLAKALYKHAGIEDISEID